MAVVRVQAPSPAHATGVETISLSWGASTTSGNLLLGVLQTRENAHDIIPPTGMTLLASQEVGTTERQWIYYEENASVRSGSQTFQFSQAGGSDCTMHLVEYSGLRTSGSFDLTATNTGSSTTPDSGTTGTTTVATELWFAALCNRNTVTQSSPTNSFTQVNRVHSANGTAGNQLEGAIYEKLVSSVGTANVSATIGTGRNWGGLIVTLKGVESGTVILDTPGAVTWAGKTLLQSLTMVTNPGAISWAGKTVNVTTTTTTVVTVDTPGFVAWAGQTVNVEVTEFVEPPFDHTSPGGWPRDPRQSRFLYHRPPFVYRDPGVDA